MSRRRVPKPKVLITWTRTTTAVSLRCTAAEDTKEDECLVPSMKVDTFTFQSVTWRREVDRPLGVSIDFDDKQRGSGGRRLRG